MSGSSLQSHWATQLAPDVIGEILLECIPFAAETRFSDRYAFNVGPRAMLPISLTHVCREWRQAAINFKKLWSFIDVDQGGRGDAARLEVYLARSGQYPLTIILTYPYADHEHTVLGRLLRESSRWRTFFCDVYGLFDASPRSTGLTHAQWTALDFPELRNVVYFNSGHTSNESDEEEDDESDDDDDSDEDEDDDWDEDDDSSDTDDGANEGDGHLLGETATQQLDNVEDDHANDDTGALVPAEPEQRFDKLLDSLPGTIAAQLRRFYSYCTDDEFVEEMPIFLKRATRIRCDFISTDSFAWEFDYGPGTSDLLLSLPRAKYAMFATGDYQKTYHRSFVFRLEFPRLRGLNLRVGRDGRGVFALRNDLPMPEYLTNLVVLRLCGRIFMTNDALTQIISALSSLVDFTIELQESRDVNVAHLADLLTPQLPVIRVPRLEHLRFFLHHKPPNNTVLPMLVARFTAPAGAPYARLRAFELYHTVISYSSDTEEIRGIPGTLMMQLEELKAQHGWDIRVAEFNKFQGELWLEPLNGEFVLDI